MFEKVRFFGDVAYREEGSGDVVLFVHGTPTHSLEYRNVVKLMSKDYRCLAIDHLGFGESKKPVNGDYSLIAHTDRLRKLLDHLGVVQFHLVVHDFGGVIGLPLLFDRKFNILSLNILNSWAWPLYETEPSLRWQKLFVSIGLLPFLYRYLNFSPRYLLPLAWGKQSQLSSEVHALYLKPFLSRQDRTGPLNFLKALFDFDAQDWQIYKRLAKISCPTQIIWGTQDGLISLNSLKRWSGVLPHARVIKLEETGHFVAEESPELLTPILIYFMSKV